MYINSPENKFDTRGKDTPLEFQIAEARFYTYENKWEGKPCTGAVLVTTNSQIYVARFSKFIDLNELSVGSYVQAKLNGHENEYQGLKQTYIYYVKTSTDGEHFEYPNEGHSHKFTVFDREDGKESVFEENPKNLDNLPYTISGEAKTEKTWF